MRKIERGLLGSIHWVKLRQEFDNEVELLPGPSEFSGGWFPCEPHDILREKEPEPVDVHVILIDSFPCPPP